jgi:hypothetical protein
MDFGILTRRAVVAFLVASTLLSTSPVGHIELRVRGKKIGTSTTRATPEVRVLFVGNSLTYFNEMPWVAEQVASSLNVQPPLRAHFSGTSGLTLRQHWDRGRVVRDIREGRYDYVVLQPQSSEIVRSPSETFEYARRIAKEIRGSGAEPLVFLTWAPRTVTYTQGEYNDQYRKLASELGAALVPVGIAWQSLRDQGLELFDGSGLHPNLAGTYLVACAFVAAIYRRSVEGAVHSFDVHFEIPEFYRKALETERLNNDQARRIQKEAWRAVRSAMTTPDSRRRPDRRPAAELP